MGIFKRLTALFCAAAIITTAIPLSDIVVSAEAEINETAQEEAEEIAESVQTEESTSETDEMQFMFTLPDNMRASVITPGVDFCLGEQDTSTVTAELEAIFSNFSEIGLNTVIINTVFEDCSYYSVNVNEGEEAFDPTAIAVSTAYSYGVSPYVVMDISHLLSDCKDGAKQIDTLISKVHRFTLKYPCDGIIIDDYYIRRNTETFGEYMDDGSGIGYTNWLYDTAEQLFSTAAD